MANGYIDLDINPLASELRDTATALVGVIPSPLALLAALPPPTHMWPMSDRIDNSYTQYNSRAYATGALSNFQQGHGVMGGAPPLARGYGSLLSTIFSHRSSPVAGGANVNDNAGNTIAAHLAVVTPMITRSGAARFYQVITKRGSTSNVQTNAGYALGLYWTGTKTVIAFRLQGATAGNFIFAIGTTDIPNFQPVMIDVQMTNTGSTKSASSLEFYVNGLPETQGSPVSDTMGTDTATNSGNYQVGGIGGTQTVDTRESFSGCIGMVTPYHGFRFTPAVHKAIYDAASVGRVQPKTVGAIAKNVLLFTDPGLDIDDIFDIMACAALHARGEFNLLGVICTARVDKAPAVVEAILRQAGITVPIAAYKGNSRENTDSYSGDTATAFGLTKTRASYLDPVTLARTVLAAAAANSVHIIEVGPQQESNALLTSAADGISPLTGSQLIAAKVASTTISAGYASSASAEYNNAQAPADANNLALNWPLPITFVPIDIASSPGSVNIAIPGNSDVSVARKAYERHGINRIGQTEPNYNRQTAYAAVLWLRDGTSTGVFAMDQQSKVNGVNASTGVNTWSASAGTHSSVKQADSNTSGKIILEWEQLLAENICAGSDAFTLT